MSDPTSLTLAEARDAIRRKTLSARELTEAHIGAMEAARPLNLFITETADRARAMAEASDLRVARGEAGPLEGLPLGIKDLYCTDGVQTTAGSHILEGFVPGYESTVSAQLWRDGAVMLGKLNLDEFAMGSSNETSYFGPAISPWRRPGSNAALVPGGSSGGSAAAVAARVCLAATATDTGGSIRQPAAFTGTVGTKPTYGRCSRWGIVAFASSLDQAGPVTRTVRDAAIMLHSMAGHDPKDSTSVDRAVPDYEAAIGRSDRRQGHRYSQGIPHGRHAGRNRRALGAGHRVAEGGRAPKSSISPCRIRNMRCRPTTSWHRPKPLRTSRATTGCATVCGSRGATSPTCTAIPAPQASDAEVRRRIMIGTYVLSAGYYDAYYLRAQKVRTLVRRDFEAAFAAGVDAILTPATPSAAFAVGEKGSGNPIDMYLNDAFTVTVNMAGLPGIAVPAGSVGRGPALGAAAHRAAFRGRHVVRPRRGDRTIGAPPAARPTDWWSV